MGRSRAPAPTKRSSAPPARSSSTHAAPPPRAAPPAPAPAPHAPAPMQQQSSGGGGMLSGLGATIAQGMAFGTGSAIAHRAVGAIAGSFGGGSSETPAPSAATTPAQPIQAAAPTSAQSNDRCGVDLQAFNNCMQDNRGSVQACDFYFQALQQCQNSSY